MEFKRVSKELEGIINSCKIPNALILKSDKVVDDLNLTLAFVKKLLLSNENNSLNKQKIIDSINSLTYPDLHIVFPIPSSKEKTKNTYEYHYKNWRDMLLKNKFQVSMSKWKDKISYGNSQPTINIDSVRSLIKKLSVSAFYSNYRVIVLWKADRMTDEAANMMLKTLEDPGNKTVFILLIEDIRKVLPTIISRCQVIGSKGAINSISFLENEEYEILFSKLMRIAFQSNKNIKVLAKLVSWSRIVGKMDKEDAQSFFKFSIELLRQAYLKNIEINELVSFTPSTEFNFASFSNFITENNIEALSLGFENAIYESKRNVKLSMIATDIAFKTTKLIHGG
tara:strand:- start:367 stop:1383 length:1017 start_codon:yes stop_codon:yes gene_type:complete